MLYKTYITITVCTTNSTSMVGKSLRYKHTFSLELSHLTANVPSVSALSGVFYKTEQLDVCTVNVESLPSLIPSSACHSLAMSGAVWYKFVLID